MLQRAKGLEGVSLEGLEDAIQAAQRRLLSEFRRTEKSDGVARGYWVGELEADTTLESDYIIFLNFLGAENNREKIRKLARYILRYQLPDGSWTIYHGGPGDISATVKAYFALRLAGHSPDEPFMIRARDAALSRGGVEAVNSFTKFYLALLGQVDWDDVPAIPPEVLLVPHFFLINIYEISCWSRAILVPLSVLYAKQALRRPEGGMLLEELFLSPRKTRAGMTAGNGAGGSPLIGQAVHLSASSGNGVYNSNGNGADLIEQGDGQTRGGERSVTKGNGEARVSDNRSNGTTPAPAGARETASSNGNDLASLFSWNNFFRLTDRVLKIAEKAPLKPLRKLALKKAQAWMVSRFEDSDGLGAIFPSMVNSVMALIVLGYDQKDPLVAKAIQELHKLEIDEGDEIRLQPCLSPIWDTSKAVNALHESGVPGTSPELVEACRWLVSKEVRKPGDWKVRLPHVNVGGWAFQFRNEFYPDVDDTSAVIMALGRLDPGQVEGLDDAVARGIDWLLNMQCSNGGWAAFDVDVHKEFLTKVPYADHNAMLDPPCADITGRCLEMFGRFPGLRHRRRVEDAISRGVAYLKDTQEEDGAWYGRWGVNYIYGTWQVVKGLTAVGEDPAQEYIQRAVSFFKSHQNEDGGWGETCASYDDPSLRGRGETTASQTAWALMGLLAAGEIDSPEVSRGVRCLLETQSPDGTWEEGDWTGTGFPCVFYLKYHLYRLYFPIFALGMYRNARRGISTIREGSGSTLASQLPAEKPRVMRSALRALFRPI